MLVRGTIEVDQAEDHGKCRWNASGKANNHHLSRAMLATGGTEGIAHSCGTTESEARTGEHGNDAEDGDSLQGASGNVCWVILQVIALDAGMIRRQDLLHPAHHEPTTDWYDDARHDGIDQLLVVAQLLHLRLDALSAPGCLLGSKSRIPRIASGHQDTVNCQGTSGGLCVGQRPAHRGMNKSRDRPGA